MTEFIVHGVPGSPFMRAVEVALREKSAPYRVRAMSPGESKSPEYLALHPFGRIPAFEHGDFRLYETQAILRYIDGVIPSPPLVPQDPRLAARMNQIIGINDCYFFPLVARAIVFNRIVGPKLLNLPIDEAAIAAAIPEGRRCIGEIERLLGEQPFLAGERLSLADVLFAPQLDFLAATPEGASLLAGTRLNAWLGRMRARPSMIGTPRPLALQAAA
ncbi:MAG TPA: glutathione S-transferase family protein [Steroidobacteraceae bacterium]|nr:glutathione S-transferase family protein [Steroidobacteraceae bacterium]